MIRLYIILALFLGIFFYLIPGWAFPPTTTHWFIMGVWLVTSIAYATIGVFTNYYILEKDGVVQHRFNKDLFYRFDDVIFIDHKYTKRTKTLRFVTRYGHLRYLILDKEGRIYEAMRDHCQLLKDADFKQLFPRIKI